MPAPVRILVSVALLALVASQVAWGDVTVSLERAAPGWVLIAFLAFNGATISSAKRWQLIVAAGCRRPSPVGDRAAVGVTYVSLWLSNFLPTAFGGDVARVLGAYRAGIRLPIAVAGAVLDRYVGLTTLVVLFLAAQIVSPVAPEAHWLWPVSVMSAAGLLALFIMLWGSAYLRIRRSWLRSRAVRFAAHAVRLIRVVGSRPESCVRIVAASVVAVGLSVAAYWGAIRSLSPSASFSIAVAVAAIGMIASAVPISLSGWGVREGAVALVLSQAGVLPASDASLVAILNGVVIGCTSLIGLAVAVVGKPDKRSVAGSRPDAMIASGRDGRV